MCGNNTAQAAKVFKQRLNFAQYQLINRVAHGDTPQKRTKTYTPSYRVHDLSIQHNPCGNNQANTAMMTYTQQQVASMSY
jgi:hypothetical protein